MTIGKFIPSLNAKRYSRIVKSILGVPSALVIMVFLPNLMAAQTDVIDLEEIIETLAKPSQFTQAGNSLNKPSGLLTKKTSFEVDKYNENYLYWIDTFAIINIPKISLTISFEYNSDELIDGDEMIVMTLASALKSNALAGNTILIAGHTDTDGSNEHNQNLSELRAEKIKSILVDTYGLSKSELVAVGFGEKLTIANLLGSAPENRRVEIYNLSNVGKKNK
jgi:outer membrane protein OmpA-like peptidoglycan-associated protein